MRSRLEKSATFCPVCDIASNLQMLNDIFFFNLSASLCVIVLKVTLETPAVCLSVLSVIQLPSCKISPHFFLSLFYRSQWINSEVHQAENRQNPDKKTGNQVFYDFNVWVQLLTGWRRKKSIIKTALSGGFLKKSGLWVLQRTSLVLKFTVLLLLLLTIDLILDKNSIDHKLSNWNIKQIHFVFINKPLTYHFLLISSFN